MFETPLKQFCNGRADGRTDRPTNGPKCSLQGRVASDLKMVNFSFWVWKNLGNFQYKSEAFFFSRISRLGEALIRAYSGGNR